MKNFVGLLLIVFLTFVILTSNSFAIDTCPPPLGPPLQFDFLLELDSWIDGSMGIDFPVHYTPPGLRFVKTENGHYIFTLTGKNVSGWVECDFYGGQSSGLNIVSWETSVPCDWFFQDQSGVIPFVVCYYPDLVASVTLTFCVQSNKLPFKIYAYVGEKKYVLTFPFPSYQRAH